MGITAGQTETKRLRKSRIQLTAWAEFKDFLRGEKALSASPEVIEALHERGETFQVRRAVNKQIAFQVNAAMQWGWADFYKKSPAVRTVIDLITNNAAQLELRLYEEIGADEREERPDHPAMESLRFPNPAYSSDGFIRYMFRAYLLYANAFATIHRGEGAKRQFSPLPPERIEVRGPGVVATSYVIWNLDGTESPPILAKDMFHWFEEGNFVDPRIGLSKLETIRAVLVEEAALQTAIVELAKSGLTEPQWIFRPLDAPEWSNEARQRFEEDIGNRLKRATKRPPVAEEGMELRGFGVSPKDAEMLEVRKYALQQVATLYGVPLGMVGLADNVEEAREEFYADTLPPICEAFCRQLNLQLLQGEYSEDDLYFEFDLNEKMMGNERLKALTGAAGVPVMLRDEARAMLNLKKVPGGQEPMTPANMVSGSDPKKLVPGAINPRASKPSDNVMPIPKPGTPAQDGSHREGEPPQAASVADALVKFYSRFGSANKQDPERWGRELAEDLAKTGLNGDANVLAVQVVENLATALSNGDRASVINNAKAEAPRLAARWEMRPEEMKQLGLPEEVIWERLGYSQAEIDQMRALRLAESLAGEG